MSAETPIVADIRLALGGRPDCRVFRNNCGALEDKRGRWVCFGLGTGSSDIIGIKKIKITPDMVGQDIGVFCAIEVKRFSGGKKSDEQKSFIKMVREFGGLSGFARTVAAAIKIIEGTYDAASDIR